MTTDASNARTAPARGGAPRWPVARTVGALLLGAALIVGLYTQGQVLVKKWLSELDFLIPVLWLCFLVWSARGRPRPLALRRLAPALLLAALLALFLFSSVVRHPWFYFLRWPLSEGDVTRSGMARWVLWTALLTPLFLRPRRRAWVAVLLVLVASEALCVRAFLRATGGHVLYRTDHPSFLFRLWEFGRTFPQLVNYNPYWNGGLLHCTGVTSGTDGPGLLFWPWLQFLPVHVFYNAGILALFVVFVPWVAVLSVRAAGGDRAASFAAGVLALGVSQHFFLWMLHFGTIGASLSSAMVLPVAAFGFRAVWLGKRDAWTGIGLVLSSLFLLLWPAGALAGVAVAAALLFNPRAWRWRCLRFLLLCGAAVLALYAGWLLVMFREGSGSVRFVLQNGAPGSGPFAWVTGTALLNGAKRLAAHLQEFHPLLLFLGLAGAAVSRSRGLRRWFLPVFIVLMLITGWSREWKPHSQLDRVAIPLAFAAVVPAAIVFSRLLRAADPRLAVVRAGLLVLLALGGYNVSQLYANRGRAPFTVFSPPMEQLVGWLRAHVPPGGRLLFAGPCVHAYGRGNVAYLPALVGREMMADDYYGFPPGTIEYNYPPPAFRYSLDTMKTFFDAYNVTHVIAYKQNWLDYFREHPEYFHEEIAIHSINLEMTVFRLERRHPTLFHAGSGTARADFNRIDATLDGPADPVVLAYNWVEGLRAGPGVELFPYRYADGITLIGVHPGDARSFTIRYRRHWLSWRRIKTAPAPVEGGGGE